ncbi:MAG: hypothetical protein ACRCZQ_03130, partial [Bacteroidales bacterium]
SPRSQSHHKGIETILTKTRGKNKRDPNRTIKELKPTCHHHHRACRLSQSHHKGIETNYYQAARNPIFNPNLTIKELKLDSYATLAT